MRYKRNGGIEHVLGMGHIKMVELSVYWEKQMEVDIKDCELWLKIMLERCANF